MKKFFLATVFVSTLIGGIALSNSVDIRGRIDNYVHRDCARSGERELNQPNFTLNEALKFRGKNVISKNPDFKYNEVGRVIFIYMIATDKFFVVVYWGNGAKDKNSDVRWIDKTWFEKDFKVLD